MNLKQQIKELYFHIIKNNCYFEKEISKKAIRRNRIRKVYVYGKILMTTNMSLVQKYDAVVYMQYLTKQQEIDVDMSYTLANFLRAI